MKKKKISIIVPAYNSELTIKRCIQSLVDQTYNNLEIIIVNDGSNDNTKEICDSFQKNDKRVKLINNENHGVSYSRNYGMDIATGDFITFVDADDYVEKDCYELLMKYVENENIDFIRYNFYSNRKTFSNDLYEFKDKFIVIDDNVMIDLYNHFLTFNHPIPNLVFLLLIRKSIADKIRFNESLYMMEDVDFYLQLFQNSKRAFFADLKLYNYYVNKNSVTQNISNCERNILGILETNKSILLKLKDESIDLKKRVNTNHYRIITNILYRMCNDRKSISSIKQIISLNNFKYLENDIEKKYLPLKNRIFHFFISNKLCYLFLFSCLCIDKLHNLRKSNLRKVGILTINDNNNYGNRLQNFALQEYLIEQFDLNVETIWNNTHRTLVWRLKREIKSLIKLLLFKKNSKRYFNFKKFSRRINHSNIIIDNTHVPKKLNNSYDYFITGSDQVWNPNHKRLTNNDLLSFADNKKRIAYAASFGVNSIDKKYHDLLNNELKKFRAISVREEAGKKIIEKETGIKNVEVLIDPTMLLSSEKWSSIAKKPKKIKNKKFILCYFLGKIDSRLEKNILKYATDNNLEIINILDINSEYYNCGPDEFLYLEKNAELICTDSFHSCVFAIIFNTPFQVFERNDEHLCMNSRLDTLLKKFHLENRKNDINHEIECNSINKADVNSILLLEKEKTFYYFYNLFKH